MVNFSKSRFVLPIALVVIGLLSASMVGTGFAQVGTIVGSVIESGTNRSLPGANVILVGTRMGAASDMEGNFRIERVPPGTYRLEARFMGYKAQIKDVQVVLGQEASVDFELKIDPLMGETVVVTGVASKTSKAVAEISVQRLNTAKLVDKANFTTIDDVLAAKVPGVSIQKGIGNFGGQFRMSVRSGGGVAGTGQPLFFVDGIKVENTNWRGGGNLGITSLLHLDPEDIASIEIIKGPAGASSYGTGGSNGVVLITTKRGRLATEGGTGKNWTINYKGTFGFHDQDREYGRDEFRYPDLVNEHMKRGSIAKNALNITGGTQTTKLYLSLDKSKEFGHLPQMSMDQLNLRANVDYFPNEKFNIQVGTQFNGSDIQTYSRGRANSYFGLVTYTRDIGNWGLKDLAYFDHMEDKNYINTYIGSMTAEFTPFAGGSKWLRGLSARLTLGIDDKDNRMTFLIEPLDEETYGWGEDGMRQISQRHSRTHTYNSDVRYEYDLFGLTASATVGAQLFDERSRVLGAQKSVYDNSALMEIEAGNEYESSYESNNHFRSAGIFTEHSFSYNNTYFGSFMVRKDFASVIGAEAASIIYPRGSFAIRLDRLGVLPTVFSFLKVRSAYGETGVLPGRTDGIPELWAAYTSPYGVGGRLSNVGNPEIRPERISEWESGIEAEIGPFALDFTYYRQWAEDSIVKKDNVPSSGKTAGTRRFNIGRVEGSGFEAQVQANFAGSQLGGWRVNLSATVSYQENEVKSLGGGDPIYSGPGGGKQWYWVGLPKMAFYNKQGMEAKFSDGTNVMENDLHPQYGEVMPVDAYYGDIESRDLPDQYPDGGRVFRGTGIPDYTGSFGGTISLGGFTLYGLFQWKTGFVLYNEARVDMIWSNIDDDWVNPEYGTANPGLGTQVWRHDELSQLIGFGDTGTGVDPLEPGTQAYIDAANEYARTSPFADANSIQPGDFLRLRELSLSYNANKLLRMTPLKSLIQGLTIGIQGTNLWLKTKKEFTGIDPEINSMGFGAKPQNMMQAGTIPPPKTITMFVKFSI